MMCSKMHIVEVLKTYKYATLTLLHKVWLRIETRFRDKSVNNTKYLKFKFYPKIIKLPTVNTFHKSATWWPLRLLYSFSIVPSNSLY